MRDGMNVIGIDDLTITVGVLIALAALIVSLWNAIKAIREMTKPAKELVVRVEALEQYAANDRKRLDEQEEAQKLLLRAMLALVEYEVSGHNVVDKEILSSLKTDISNYLINR